MGSAFTRIPRAGASAGLTHKEAVGQVVLAHANHEAAGRREELKDLVDHPMQDELGHAVQHQLACRSTGDAVSGRAASKGSLLPVRHAAPLLVVLG
jgi:hypothetical protein